ncbi:hypothetical protein [Gryllotalpicola koreensis]|uniref:Bacterial Ig-like domain-containing protein n=1 Tax=Gryllotalpicola koreensis TaxID=993086 RepID=A0ABP8A1L1_9MICO
MSKLSWIQGDTTPIRLEVGADLTGATVVVHVHPWQDVTVLVEQVTATIIDATSGTISFIPPALEPDGYTIDAQITGTQGTVITDRIPATVNAHGVSDQPEDVFFGGNA